MLFSETREIWNTTANYIAPTGRKLYFFFFDATLHFLKRVIVLFLVIVLKIRSTMEWSEKDYFSTLNTCNFDFVSSFKFIST